MTGEKNTRRRHLVPANGPALLKEFERALEQNDVAAAVATRERAGIELEWVMNIVATLVALRVDHCGRRLYDSPERRELWACVPTQTQPPIRWPEPVMVYGGKIELREQPQQSDAQYAAQLERTLKDVRRDHHLKQSLWKKGAQARQLVEGEKFGERQRARAQRPRRQTAEKAVIEQILRADPNAKGPAIEAQLVKQLKEAFQPLGFKDRLSRLRKALQK